MFFKITVWIFLAGLFGLFFGNFLLYIDDCRTINVFRTRLKKIARLIGITGLICLLVSIIVMLISFLAWIISSPLAALNIALKILGLVMLGYIVKIIFSRARLTTKGTNNCYK